MLEAILSVVAIALVGALTVPVMMLLLARFGYFEPVHLVIFGKHLHFAPRVRVVAGYSNASTSVFSPAMVSASIPATLIIVGQLHAAVPRQPLECFPVTAEIITFTDATITAPPIS